MTPRTTIKVALALTGLVLYGAGIRFGNEALRWSGIGVVGVAALLRFWKEPPSSDERSDAK